MENKGLILLLFVGKCDTVLNKEIKTLMVLTDLII